MIIMTTILILLMISYTGLLRGQATNELRADVRRLERQAEHGAEPKPAEAGAVGVSDESPYVCVYIYMYIYVFMYIYIYIYFAFRISMHGIQTRIQQTCTKLKDVKQRFGNMGLTQEVSTLTP